MCPKDFLNSIVIYQLVKIADNKNQSVLFRLWMLCWWMWIFSKTLHPDYFWSDMWARQKASREGTIFRSYMGSVWSLWSHPSLHYVRPCNLCPGHRQVTLCIIKWARGSGRWDKHHVVLLEFLFTFNVLRGWRSMTTFLKNQVINAFELLSSLHICSKLRQCVFMHSWTLFIS